MKKRFLLTSLVAWVAAWTWTSGQFNVAFEVGDRAPSFQVKTVDGTKVKFSDLKGKVVVLNFWFIACPPCQEEMPDLNELVETFSGEDVVFLGLSPVDTTEEVKKFLENREFKYQLVGDGAYVVDQFGVTGAPTHMIIDREGRIQSILFGPVTDLEDQMIKPIRGLLGS